MEQVILGLLMMQSMTIYEMNKAFNQGISLFYSASYGALQTAVKKLLKKELIIVVSEQDQGRKKKIYRINEEGRRIFKAWMLDEIPVNKLEVTALSKLYFMGHLEKKEDKLLVIEEVISKIEETEKHLEEIRNKYMGLNQIQVDDLSKYQLLTLDYGFKSQHFSKDWFIDLYKSIELE